METKITFTFGSLEEAKELLEKLTEEEENTNEKIDKKIKEEKAKKKTKKSTKKKNEEVEDNDENDDEDDGVTIADVKEALEQHANEFGKRNTNKVLKKFAPNVKELKKKNYAELIAALVEAMEDDDE